MKLGDLFSKLSVEVRAKLWDLPECIWKGVLDQWMTAKEIGRLDSATCNKRLRRHSLLALSTLALLSTNERSTGEYLRWSMLRGMLLSKMHIPAAMADQAGLCTTLMRLNGKYLREVHIPGPYADTTVVATALLHCTALRVVVITGHTLRESTLTALLSLATLERVQLINGIIIGDGVHLQSVAPHPRLQCIEFDDIVAKEPLLVAVVKKCPRIRHLMIYHGTGLTPRGIVEVVRATPECICYAFAFHAHAPGPHYGILAERASQLVDLNLAFSKVTDAVLETILTNCQRLCDLHLLDCKLLTSQTVFNIARYCPLVEDLDLDGIHLDDAALIELATKCRHLWRVFLPRCAGVTDTGIAFLGKTAGTLKHFQMHWNPPFATEKVFPLFQSLETFYAVGYTSLSDTAQPSNVQVPAPQR